ncbi:MAG: TOBE domain-containing protein, partial [Ramlibacter sp.]
MNLLPATWNGNAVTVEGSTHPVNATASVSRPVTLGIRPGDLQVQAQGLAVRVLYVEELGDHAILNVQAGTTRLKVKTPGLSPAKEGETVHLGFAPEAAHLFDPASGMRLA